MAILKVFIEILNDRNYKKYAVKQPKNIKKIYEIDNYGQRNAMKKKILKKSMRKFIIILFLAVTLVKNACCRKCKKS